MQNNERLTLMVNIPEKVVVKDEHVTRIVTDTSLGSMGFLPHRLDIVAPLVPGILVYTDESGVDHYVAIDEGILLKAGLVVRISARRAVVSDDLESLQDHLVDLLENMSEHETQTRRILTKFEDDFIRLYHEVHREQT